MAAAGVGGRVKKADAQRARMREVLRVLDRHYPDAECSLTFRNPFELLIAVISSAQCVGSIPTFPKCR